jgi:putative MATE family efflux protein
MNQRLDLTTGDIKSLIFKLSIPASVGFFFNTMFNVVDTYFAGHISTRSLAALSLSFPVFFLIISFGSGFSTGTTALIGNALGEGAENEGRSFAVQGLVFGFFFSLVLAAAGYFASPFLFGVLGAEDAYLEEALRYMRTIFLGTTFFFLNYMCNAVLTALGDTRSFRNFLMLGFGLNCLLDPLFIMGWFGMPELGIRGVALATVIIQGGGMVYLFVRVSKSGLLDNVRLRELIPDLKRWKAVLGQGIPASLNLLTIAAGIFVITYYVGRFGPQAVAAYGTAVRIEQIALLPSLGFNISTLTLVARNSGAGAYERIWETLRKTMKFGAFIMLSGAVLVFVFAGPVISLFTDDPAVIEIGTLYLKIDALVLYAYVLLGIHVSTLQGIKRPVFPVIIGIYRQILAPLLVFYLLTKTAGMGIAGVWWGILIITWSAAFIALFFARSTLTKETKTGQLRI